MNGLVTQLGPLIGVVVGVVATFIATAAGARAQWRREQRSRAEDRKLDAYVAYVDASSRVFELSLRLARTRGLPTRAGPIPLESGLDQLTQATIERSQSWYRLQIVGDPATISAGRDWIQAMWAVEKFALGDFTDTSEFRQAVTHCRNMRTIFHEATRRSLGIESGTAVDLERELPVPPQSPRPVPELAGAA